WGSPGRVHERLTSMSPGPFAALFALLLPRCLPRCLPFLARFGREVSMIRTFVVPAIVLAGALALVACAPSDDAPSGTGGRSGAGGNSGGGGSSGGVTYTKDVQPILAVKCAPCHTTEMMGGHNIGTTYADLMKTVVSLDAPPGCYSDGFDRMMPKKVG